MELILNEGKTPFVRKVYELCGDEIGDTLTLKYVEVNSGAHSMTANFYATRVLEQREYEILEDSVKRAANGINVDINICFEYKNTFDIKDGIMLVLRKERPFYALALATAKWEVEGRSLIITLHGNDRMEVEDIKRYICDAIKKMFKVNFTVEII